MTKFNLSKLKTGYCATLSATALLLSISLIPVSALALGTPESLDDELTQALDREPNPQNGKLLFEMCEGCHSTGAQGSTDGIFPQLAGQHRNVIIKQLSDFRVGNRENPDMEPFAEGDILGGPQGISDIAAYLESLPMTSSPGVGPGKDLERGAELYDDNCAICHDDEGEGFDAYFFPKVQGQHYEYTLRQLMWMKEGKRRNVYHGMLRRVQKMSDEELRLVSDYLSRLSPDDEV